MDLSSLLYFVCSRGGIVNSNKVSQVYLHLAIDTILRTGLARTLGFFSSTDFDPQPTILLPHKAGPERVTASQLKREHFRRPFLVFRRHNESS